MKRTFGVGAWFARWLFAMGAALTLFLVATRAEAYPWMIRHGYTGCLPCHTDPSGGTGVLTEYGRAQGDLLLRMPYAKVDESGEASPTARFAGFVPLPAQLRLGGDFREAVYTTQAENAPLQQQFITMRADATADVKIGRFRAAGNLGYAPQGDLYASLTDNPSGGNLISREHWIGVELDDDGGWLLRAGRMALPFGIRMIEHTLWARSLTRTDFDDTQEYGASLSLARDKLRGEVMGIVGNFQIHPDDFRERGYAAYVEFAPMNTLSFGVSSLFTRATRDIIYGVTDYRFANGPFLRYAPFEQLVLFAEIDSNYQSLTWNGHRGGFAGFAQADYEPTQGFHVMLTGETMNSGTADEPTSFDWWLTAVWFFLPHMDVRIDAIYSTLGQAPTPTTPSSYTNVSTWLAQFHVFL